MEHVFRIIFVDHLSTSPNQFGFKKKSSTTHSLFCLKETVNYYINNGSRVYCSFLDASKAFDRLVHAGLFLKLMERRIPLIFLDIIVTWHNGLFCRVKWDGHLSDWFSITAGVRQGGVLSPDFYNIYVDELISILKSTGVGCHIRKVFAAALFYADDMSIIAPSLKGLQILLDACLSYCKEWDILLNAKKSKNLFFGKGSVPNHELRLSNEPIPWVDEWTYLGVKLKSGPRFGCCVKETIAKFYRALNSILRVEGRSDDMVMLRLLEAHCIPILTYAIEVVHVKDRDYRRKLRVAYNSVYRKMFGYSYRESVTELQHCLKRPTWEELLDKRKAAFLQKFPKLPAGSLVRALSSYAYVLVC